MVSERVPELLKIDAPTFHMMPCTASTVGEGGLLKELKLCTHAHTCTHGHAHMYAHTLTHMHIHAHARRDMHTCVNRDFRVGKANFWLVGETANLIYLFLMLSLHSYL